jgi:xanthine dehydrogenase YagT iron-sulfur-binding subunit
MMDAPVSIDVHDDRGLAHGGHPLPLKEAFARHDALQCGYCTPGQIMSALALIAEGRAIPAH